MFSTQFLFALEIIAMALILTTIVGGLIAVILLVKSIIADLKAQKHPDDPDIPKFMKGGK